MRDRKECVVEQKIERYEWQTVSAAKRKELVVSLQLALTV